MNCINAGKEFQINCRGKLLDLSSGPKIMGILNTTPDSFFDGGTFHKTQGKVDLDRALEHALEMIREGASIIDIGGESSRPGAEKISVREEIMRTIPLIELLQRKTDIIISIDTWKAEVAEKAFKAGAHMVNDISGFTFDGDLPGVCSQYRAAAVLMHTPVKPESMQWSTDTGSGKGDILARVSCFLEQSIAVAEKNSIHDLIIDPGFGFGKSVEENFQLLAGLRSLQALKRPILAGLSRKSFLGHAITPKGEEILPPSERLTATITADTIALMNGASILRVHDVEAAAQCLRVLEAMKRF
ncbi:dihydropteroate synthase [Chlorobium sp. KB01]|uniref:dihydropteroate synthase n=1 Tax=Chlorobium sp. KB01 TaxID=1917528 RepID=UPI000977A62E|nr:dihydropteroate synthase [Chlorobium sp. KB01]